MLRKQQISSNPYFIIPFIAWVIAGAVLLVVLSRRDIFFAINTHYSDIADTVMYHLTSLGEVLVIIPVLAALFIFPRFRNWWYFLTALLCNIIPLLVQQSLKTFFNAPRPRLLFYDRLSSMHYLPHWPVLLQNSFPSGHSEGAFSFFCFLSLILPGRYRKFGLLFFFLALSVCYSRIYLTAHFFEDVYVGSIIGTVVTTIVYMIMYKYKDRLTVKKDTFS